MPPSRNACAAVLANALSKKTTLMVVPPALCGRCPAVAASRNSRVATVCHGFGGRCPLRFKESLQHPVPVEGCSRHGHWSSTDPDGGSSAVLEVDSGGLVDDRGCGLCRRAVHDCEPVVPSGWRSDPNDCSGALWPVFVLGRAGGDRRRPGGRSG